MAISDKLDKTKRSFKEKVALLLNKFSKVDESYFESLEDLLISNDVGAKLSLKIIDELKDDCKINKITFPNQITDLLFDKLKTLYSKQEYDSQINLSNKTNIILVFGVNGVGKTTSIAKLANIYKNKGLKVLLVGADTFRMGAIEQLDVWAKRVNVDIVSGHDNSDPSSVIYDGVSKGVKEGYDLVIVDTAGRLQTKDNLMNEANKMYRVISKILPEQYVESLLVLDSTIGQNGIYQAKAFLDNCNITGIILTKMDGTSKGGIVLGIKDQLNIPVKYIGVGEGINDLMEFDLDEYLKGILD